MGKDREPVERKRDREREIDGDMMGRDRDLVGRERDRQTEKETER